MPPPSVSFTVFGAPKPKAGMRPVPIKRGGIVVGSRMTASSKAGPAWAATVQDVALSVRCKVMGNEEDVVYPEGPLVLVIYFFFPRPKSGKAAKRLFPTTRPDLTKCVRCLEDALTGVIFSDDSQVVEIRTMKRYAQPGESPRAEVIVVTPFGGDQVTW